MSIWTNSLLALLSLPIAAAADPLKVAPPPGYCIDDDASGRMMVIGPCAGSDAMPAVLTVMPGAEGSAAALADRDAVAQFFGTQAGRAALSRRGRASDVTVVEMRGRSDALLIRLRDRAASGESWRVLAPIAGRMVTLTVTGGDAAQALALADKFLTSMRRANGG